MSSLPRTIQPLLTNEDWAHSELLGLLSPSLYQIILVLLISLSENCGTAYVNKIRHGQHELSLQRIKFFYLLP